MLEMSEHDSDPSYMTTGIYYKNNFIFTPSPTIVKGAAVREFNTNYSINRMFYITINTHIYIHNAIHFDKISFDY